MSFASLISLNISTSSHLSVTRRVTASSRKVLAWLEQNLTSFTECPDCPAEEACTSAISDSWSVRGKILEDRLLRLNRRRRSLEQRAEEMEERRRVVFAMADHVLNTSGKTLDISLDELLDSLSDGEEQITVVLNDKVLLDTQRMRTPTRNVHLSFLKKTCEDTREQQHKSDNKIPDLLDVLSPSSRRNNLSKRSMTTQTSASLLPNIPGSPIQVETYYNKDGFRCTWC